MGQKFIQLIVVFVTVLFSTVISHAYDDSETRLKVVASEEPITEHIIIDDANISDLNTGTYYENIPVTVSSYTYKQSKTKELYIVGAREKTSKFVADFSHIIIDLEIDCNQAKDYPKLREDIVETNGDFTTTFNLKIEDNRYRILYGFVNPSGDPMCRAIVINIYDKNKDTKYLITCADSRKYYYKLYKFLYSL